MVVLPRHLHEQVFLGLFAEIRRSKIAPFTIKAFLKESVPDGDLNCTHFALSRVDARALFTREYSSAEEAISFIRNFVNFRFAYNI